MRVAWCSWKITTHNDSLRKWVLISGVQFFQIPWGFVSYKFTEQFLID